MAIARVWIRVFLLAGMLAPGVAGCMASMVPVKHVLAQDGTASPRVQASPQVKSGAEQAPAYDEAIFEKRIPGDQLVFLKQMAGMSSNDVWRDKRFRKLMKNGIPDCTFHYGVDMPLSDALDMVIKGSKDPVRIRDGRYMTVSGERGPYLNGRGFVWIDLREGIVLGGFYFHPTNGEPTPSVNLFSWQVREEALGLNELPPAFAEDLAQWSMDARVPRITTRYFITGSRRKVLLEHDEDFCAPVDGTVPPAGDGCLQMEADALDLDLDAANYVEQTHHATNATAWMINGPEQVAFLQMRITTCGGGPDPLGCRIRMTRERTERIIHRPVRPHPGRR